MKTTLWLGTGIGVIVLIVVGVDLYWHEFFPRRFFVVEEGTLFRGARQRDRALEGILEKHDCRTVLSLTGGVESNAEVTRDRGLRYMAYNWNGSGIGPYEEYRDVARILADEERQPVFYHCAGGRHRTNAATFAYQLESGATEGEAFEHIVRYGFDREEDEKLAAHLEGYAAWYREQSE